VRPERLQPFVADVAAARQLPPLTSEQLGQGNLALSYDAMLMNGCARRHDVPSRAAEA